MTNPISPSLSELLDHDPELLAAAYAPVNWMIDQLWAGCDKSPAAEWVLERHDLAKQLNEQSTRDGSAANNGLPVNK